MKQRPQLIILDDPYIKPPDNWKELLKAWCNQIPEIEDALKERPAKAKSKPLSEILDL